MNRMSRLVCASMCIFAGAALAAGNAANAATWKHIFNGKDLSGWSAHYASRVGADAPAATNIFEVKRGEIHAYPTQVAGTPQPLAYIITDADFKDYVISLEYKWGEKKFPPRLNDVRDAGLLYHAYRVRPSEWPASAEAQIQEGDTGDSWA
jgi:hypothetical protein